MINFVRNFIYLFIWFFVQSNKFAIKKKKKQLQFHIENEKILCVSNRRSSFVYIFLNVMNELRITYYEHPVVNKNDKHIFALQLRINCQMSTTINVSILLL